MQTDRTLELRRLSALLVAAQRSMIALEAEEARFLEEISQLEEANKYLSEAWKAVEERVQKNKALKEKRDRLQEEANLLQQSRTAQEGIGTSGPFFGFQGLQFHDTGRAETPSIGMSLNPLNSRSGSGFHSMQFRDINRTGTPLPSFGSGSGLKFRSGDRSGFGSLPLLGSAMLSATNSTPSRPYHVAPPQAHSQHSMPSRFTATTVANISSQDQGAAGPMASGTNSSYLSQLGHHEQRPECRLGPGPSPPISSKFSVGQGAGASSRSRINLSHQGSALTGTDMSPPHTPVRSHTPTHSLPAGSSQFSAAATTPDTSSFAALQQGSSQGALAAGESDHSANCSPIPDQSHGLQQNNPGIDQDTEYLDDATLLQATVSAEQQLEQQLPEENTK